MRVDSRLRYNPHMADGRTAWEQVKSGLRISGLIVLTFCIFIALVVSLSHVTGRVDPPRSRHPLLGVLSTATLVAVMFQTTRYWAKWLVGILGLGLFRLWGTLMFKGFFELPTNISFTTLLAWFLYTAAAVALTVRHASRPPKGAERFGLTGFVVCVSLAMINGSSHPLFYGLGLLAVGEITQTIMVHARHRTHHA